MIKIAHKRHGWLYWGSEHPGHAHYVCPVCHGGGFVEEPPESEKESLTKYRDNLEKEIEAVKNRLSEL